MVTLNTRTMSSSEVRTAGLAAVARELGPAGLIRFLQEFDTGRGDYTAERHQWLGNPTVDQLVARIRARRTADTAQ